MDNIKIGKCNLQLGYLMTQVSFLKQRIINSALKELDITYIQFVIIAGVLELGQDEKLVTQQDISRERRLDKAMVSNVVKTLIKKELMIRHQHPSDERAFTLSLTQEGINIALKGINIAIREDDIFFAKINKINLYKELETLLENNE